MKIRANVRLFYITAVAVTILLAPAREAKASCSSGRQVIVGQLPDVFFTPGGTNVKEFTYTYKNIGGGATECGIYAESTMPGVAVINTYGDQRHEAFPPEVTGAGVSQGAGGQVTTTLNAVRFEGIRSGHMWLRTGIERIAKSGEERIMQSQSFASITFSN